MTDITELAQREKFEVWAHSQKLSLAYGDCGYAFSSTEMAWRAWMASSAELVAALEKAQQLETLAAEMAIQISKGLAEAYKRIAELESRTVTVKLASRRLPSDYVDGEFGNDDLAAIHNACRLECKVSVEKYLSAHGIVVKWEAE
ncbi:hypothetical protein ACH696_08270 [Klebsiella aerogenes]|uniref:hypothetical protein n=1 Tax=Klebsiella aerogenes TaxID=548 RepID=UPI001D0B0A66|nr:hypothetical protein [Klebsiella aerogenes]